MKKLLKDLSAQVRSLYNRYRSKEAPSQVRYREEIFEIRLLEEAIDNSQYSTRLYYYYSKDLLFRGLVLYRSRAYNYFSRIDRRIFSLSR